MDQKTTLSYLEELALMMHPNLGSNNHTYRLIEMVYNDRTKLTNRDLFDLGKYYDRMIAVIETKIGKDKREDYVRAVLDLKNRCYGSYQLSSITPYGK